MRIFDWLRSSAEPERAEAELSRRDFFARMAGRRPPEEEQPISREGPDAEGEAQAFTFFVAGFPFYDGPVLVPMLKPELEFELRPDPEHFSDPNAVRIDWGRDHLGYVAPEYSGAIRELLSRGERLRCRALRIDPTAELPRVLEVEITRVPQEQEPEPEPHPMSAEAEESDRQNMTPPEGE
jgi:hypothetical protein